MNIATEAAAAAPDLLALFAEIGALAQMTGALVETCLPQGFQASQFAVINHLFLAGDGQTPVALARTFAVPKTSMTHTLIVLEKHGLVRIEPNPRDGRSKTVWLTPRGRTLRSVAVQGIEGNLAPMAAMLDALRLADLRDGVALLRARIEDLNEARAMGYPA